MISPKCLYQITYIHILDNAERPDGLLRLLQEVMYLAVVPVVVQVSSHDTTAKKFPASYPYLPTLIPRREGSFIRSLLTSIAPVFGKAAYFCPRDVVSIESTDTTMKHQINSL